MFRNNNIVASIHRTRSAADLALLVATAPHGFSIRHAAAEAADRAPHVAAVLDALADRLVRHMEELTAAEAKLRTAAAQFAAAPAATDAPKRTTRKPRAAATAAAAATDASGVPYKLPPAELPLPDSYDALSPLQLAWFDRYMPFTLRNWRIYGRVAGERTPQANYDRMQRIGVKKKRTKELRVSSWDPRTDIEGLICALPYDAKDWAAADLPRHDWPVTRAVQRTYWGPIPGTDYHGEWVQRQRVKRAADIRAGVTLALEAADAGDEPTYLVAMAELRAEFGASDVDQAECDIRAAQRAAKHRAANAA